MDETKPPARSRKRGGQKGNKDAFKHGFYSRSFTRAETSRLAFGGRGEFHDEEALLRILIERTFQSMREQKMHHEEVVATLRAVALAVGRIESIHRSRRIIYDNQDVLEKALEELKYIPFEED